LFDQALTIYGLLHGTLAWSPKLAGLIDSHVRIGLGPAGGVRLRLTPALILLTTARWHWLPGQDLRGTYRVDATLRLRCLDWLAIGLEGRKTPDALETQLLAFSYF
jgi:hypothetical protein